MRCTTGNREGKIWMTKGPWTWSSRGGGTNETEGEVIDRGRSGDKDISNRKEMINEFL